MSTSGVKSKPTNMLIWTPVMTKVLLDFVDENAGDSSLFTSNREAALTTAGEKIRPVTPTDSQASINNGRILNKLQKVVLKAKLYEDSSVRELWKFGKSILDLSKLAAGTYTAEEIAKSRETRAIMDSGMTESVENAAGDGKERKVKNSKRSNARSGKARDETSDGEFPQAKKRKTSPITEQHANHGPVRAFPTRDRSTRRTNYEEISETENEDINVNYTGQPPMVDGRSSNALNDIPVSMTVQTHKVYACEVCGDEFLIKDLLINHKTMHDQSVSAADIQTLFEKLSRNVDVCDSQKELLNLAKEDHAGKHADVDEIEKTLKTLQSKISCETTHFLTSSHIDGNADVEFDLKSYEDSLRGLLRSIFGTNFVDNFDLYGTSVQPGVKLFGFILSVIGCAITDWTLCPVPQGGIQDGILEKMNELLRARSVVFQDNVMEMATREYLEVYIKPRVSRSAQSLADSLFRLLRHFLPETTQIEQLEPDESADRNVSGHDHVPLDVDKEILQGKQAISQITNNAELDLLVNNQQSSGLPHIWPPATRRHPEQAFLEHLYTWFETALNLRVDMEIAGNALWRFNFPVSGCLVDAKVMDAKRQIKNTRRPLPEDENETWGMSPLIIAPTVAANGDVRSRVLLGLMPTVYGRFRNWRDRPYRDEREVISKAIVFVHDQ